MRDAFPRHPVWKSSAARAGHSRHRWGDNASTASAAIQVGFARLSQSSEPCERVPTCTSLRRAHVQLVDSSRATRAPRGSDRARAPRERRRGRSRTRRRTPHARARVGSGRPRAPPASTTYPSTSSFARKASEVREVRAARESDDVHLVEGAPGARFERPARGAPLFEHRVLVDVLRLPRPGHANPPASRPDARRLRTIASK